MDHNLALSFPSSAILPIEFVSITVSESETGAIFFLAFFASQDRSNLDNAFETSLVGFILRAASTASFFHSSYVMLARHGVRVPPLGERNASTLR